MTVIVPGTPYKATALLAEPVIRSPATRQEPLKPAMRRPCSCGCDQRGGYKGVGYLHGQGSECFVTVWAPDELTYQRMRNVFGGEG